MSIGIGTGAWGEGSWGFGSWGGAIGEGFTFVDAIAIRENVIRLEFDRKVSFTNLLGTDDASRVELWSITPVAGTVGLSGDPTRLVRVVQVTLSGEDDGVAIADRGRFLNLVLDRPMTPYPGEYVVSWFDVFSSDLGSSSSGTANISSLYRLLEPPQLEVARPSKDFANPQTIGAATTSLPQPNAAFTLGTFGVDDTGDYALDEGVVNLKKRIIRRLVTRKGAFAHLPNYGVGIPEQAKKLGQAIVISKLKAEAEVQIAQEPDVLQSRVIVVINSETPNLVRFRVAVKSKAGKPIAFEVPFDVTT